MAKNQYNSWEPVLEGVVGNMQAQPRVFAHDAKLIVIGAINNTAGDGGFTLSNGGTDFVAGDVGSTMTAATGSATFTITSVSGGAITGLDVVNLGSGYAKSGSPLAFQPVALSGGTGEEATFTVTNINIPNTQKRGCCLYVGSSGSCEVEMESGSIATFAAINAGSFLPILVVRVVAGSNTDVTNVLAIY